MMARSPVRVPPSGQGFSHGQYAGGMEVPQMAYASSYQPQPSIGQVNGYSQQVPVGYGVADSSAQGGAMNSQSLQRGDVGSSSSYGAGLADLRGGLNPSQRAAQVAQQQSYQAELRVQMEEKKARDSAEGRRRRGDLRGEQGSGMGSAGGRRGLPDGWESSGGGASLANFGMQGGGAGAPIRDMHGNVVTNLKQYNLQRDRNGGHSPSPSISSNVQAGYVGAPSSGPYGGQQQLPSSAGVYPSGAGDFGVGISPALSASYAAAPGIPASGLPQQPPTLSLYGNREDVSFQQSAVNAPGMPLGQGHGPMPPVHSSPAMNAMPAPASQAAGSDFRLGRTSIVNPQSQMDIDRRQAQVNAQRNALAEQMEEARQRKEQAKRAKLMEERQEEERLERERRNLRDQYDRELEKEGKKAPSGDSGAGKTRARDAPPPPAQPIEEYKADLARQIEEKKRRDQERKDQDRRQREEDDKFGMHATVAPARSARPASPPIPTVAKRMGLASGAMAKPQSSNSPSRTKESPGGAAVVSAATLKNVLSAPLPPSADGEDSITSLLQQKSDPPPVFAARGESPAAGREKPKSPVKIDLKVGLNSATSVALPSGAVESSPSFQSRARRAPSPIDTTAGRVSNRVVMTESASVKEQPLVPSSSGFSGGGIDDILMNIGIARGEVTLQPPSPDSRMPSHREATKDQEVGKEKKKASAGRRAGVGVPVEGSREAPRVAAAARRQWGGAPVFATANRSGRRRRGGSEEEAARKQNKPLVAKMPFGTRARSKEPPATNLQSSPAQRQLKQIGRQVDDLMESARNLKQSLEGESVFLRPDAQLEDLFVQGGSGRPSSAMKASPRVQSAFPASRIPKLDNSSGLPERAASAADVRWEGAPMLPHEMVAAGRLRNLQFPLKEQSRDQLDTFLMDFLHKGK